MKMYVKSSFLAVLFMAVFCVGMSSAYAKTVKKHEKVTKTTNVKTVPLRCQMQAMDNLLMIIKSKSHSDLDLLTLFLNDTCKPGNYQNGNWVLIVHKDCTTENKKINPFKS